MSNVSDARDLGAFIPSYLDDFNLDMPCFRLYAHISRRAGSGLCWESIDKMADSCHMNRKTAYKAFQFLQDHRLILVEKRKGQTSLITLTNYSIWVPVPNQVQVKACPKSGTGVSQKRDTGIPETVQPHVPDQVYRPIPNQGHKGTPIEVTPIKDPDPILSVQQAETDPAVGGGKKGKTKGTEKNKGVNNRNKSDIYAKLKNPESFESFWDWYQTKLDSIPPDREGKRVKAGSKNKAAEAWKACIEDGNKLDLFREGCRKFDFMGTRGVPHAERFIRNEIYLNGISNGSGADFVALTGTSVTEEDRNSWIEEMREKGQKFYRGPGGVIDQERAAFFHEHAYIFEEVA